MNKASSGSSSKLFGNLLKMFGNARVNFGRILENLRKSWESGRISPKSRQNAVNSISISVMKKGITRSLEDMNRLNIMLSWQQERYLEHKNYVFSPPCNILFELLTLPLTPICLPQIKSTGFSHYINGLKKNLGIDLTSTYNT